ncbi:MAG: hypothetical protein WC867_01835 [Candidatus Pacearchaeota archaeon]|jgi:hypothetical protein
MKKKYIISIIILLLIIIALWLIFIFNFKSKGISCTQEVKICPDGSYVSRSKPNCEFTPCKETNILSEYQAIYLLKEKYPDFKDYPSEKLPPKGILSERENEGWYIAFMQYGSGRPILNARCFLVKDNNEILDIGEFKPEFNDMRFEITPKNCS